MGKYWGFSDISKKVISFAENDLKWKSMRYWLTA